MMSNPGNRITQGQFSFLPELTDAQITAQIKWALYKPENERDYGAESIEILLQVMENNRDDLVVILAGYKEKMDRFFHSNPGMRSRIAHHADFPDYTAAELLAIGQLKLAAQNYRFSAAGEQAFAAYSHCACASRISPMRARFATHWTARACARPTACSPPPAPT